MNGTSRTLVSMSIGLLLVIVLGRSVEGQNAPAIKGRIVDERGRPLESVDVFVVDPTGNDKHASSDRNGNYEVPVPTANEVRVVLFDTGDANAKRVTVAFHIDATVTSEVSWVLKPLNSLDRETRDLILAYLRQLSERTKSEELRRKIGEFF